MFMESLALTLMLNLSTFATPTKNFLNDIWQNGKTMEHGIFIISYDHSFSTAVGLVSVKATMTHYYNDSVRTYNQPH